MRQQGEKPSLGANDESQRLSFAVKDLQEGRLERAKAGFETVVKHNPRSFEAWDGLGVAAFRSNDAELAAKAFRAALAIRPETAGIKQSLAAALRKLGQAAEAIKLYEQAAAARTPNATLLNNWGNALADVGRLPEAAETLQRAVDLVPTSAMCRINLARVLLKLDRPADALSTLEPAVATGADNGALLAEYGNALLANERFDDAIAAFRDARRCGYEPATMLHNLATGLQYVGDMVQSEEAYRAALAADPNSAVSRRQLAYMRKHKSSDDEISALKAQLKTTGRSAGDRAEIYLGLAKAFDDIGDYDQAFENLQAGNQLIRTIVDYSAAKNTEFIDSMIASFGREFLASRETWGLRTERPVFILGMPRSGTTLTEQILSSHPDVYGAGELMKVSEIFAQVRKSLSPTLDIPRSAHKMTADLVRGAAESYMAYLAGLDQGSRLVTDKMPFNYRYLGFIALMFPSARIIHCVRHPADIAISCYFARFHEALSFSSNLPEIGRYYRDYERVMDHWTRAIGNPMLSVSYERLVADQEFETRRLLAFCGLNWDDRCLEFHKNERPILTASSWQVRQPMYSSSVGRWRNYRHHLRPLFAALGMTDPEGWKLPKTASEPQPEFSAEPMPKQAVHS